MNTAELPQWATTAGIIGTIFGSSIVAIWSGRKAKPASDTGHGTAHVVAASFVDKALLEKLIEHIALLNRHMEVAAAYRHDEKVAREAAAHALLERGLRP